MITITNVSKEFEKTDERKKKTKFLADDNISFTVPDGQIVGLLGPNGAGKTTLLRIIAGIMKPTNGTVSFDGLTHEKNSVEIKKSIAFLSGNTKLYKDLSTVELLEICGSYYGMEKDEIKKRSEEVFEKLQMDSFKNQKIGKLSTGQTQRVGIARCVLHDPHYYILDEVTSGLDIMASQVVLDFIREEKAKGKCIIYSTHYMEEAENLCDSVVLLNKGKVIRIGTAAEIEKETETTDMRSAFFKLIKEDIK